MKSTGTAYGLWCLSLIGISGIHRFYLGRKVSGVIWLLTFGLLGFGQLIDLFMIPKMIAGSTGAGAAGMVGGEEPPAQAAA